MIWCRAAVALLLALGIWAFSYAMQGYGGAQTRLIIPTGSTEAQLRDSLVKTLGDDYGTKVYRIWRMSGGNAAGTHGLYVIEPGQRVYAVARMLKNGRQTPVEGKWTDARTMQQMAERLTRSLECTPEQFLAAADTILSARGYRPEEYRAAFLPDTYQFYWDATGEELVNRLLDYTDRFWTADRKAKAEKLGLTPVEVATLASIVEEESSKLDERPVIARVYLNRLARGMKLQADPTVKFAVGDPTIRRITQQHLAKESPYNTYLHEGLPPGPIRIVDKRTIDAVLDAPVHDYIYMCAREDFSGYHNFARDFATHRKNADRYRAELTRRGIR